jgi:hypothetical protein
MDSLVVKIIVGLAIVLFLIKPLMQIVAALVLRSIARGFLANVGEKALAEQPDEIHLTLEPNHDWADSATVQGFLVPLVERGFQEAGIYRVAEMEGVVVGFMVQPVQRVAACIYEHPQVGHWVDVVCRYQDGRSLTYTTAPPTGLDQRPGSETVRALGAGSDELFDRMIRERPAGELESITPTNVVDRFVTAYAEETAWRKNKGISAGEVARNVELMEAATPGSSR